jgi:hypothetical protein
MQLTGVLGGIQYSSLPVFIAGGFFYGFLSLRKVLFEK